MLAERINRLLPQTQCTKCGFDGCAPYARAIANDSAPINRCPPGGDAGIIALAQLLERPIIALDTTCGVHKALQVAVIDEKFCIGCTLCIQACPVDAILGASKVMHTVLSEDCTGCDLCIAPCPVDCIEMVDVEPTRSWTRSDAEQARMRVEQRQVRLDQAPASLKTRDQTDNVQAPLSPLSPLSPLAPLAPLATLAPLAAIPETLTAESLGSRADKQKAVQAALARARARRHTTPP